MPTGGEVLAAARSLAHEAYVRALADPQKAMFWLPAVLIPLLIVLFCVFVWCASFCDDLLAPSFEDEDRKKR